MLYFVRHGATDWNDHVNTNGEKDPKVQGRHDIPLNARGQRQALQLAEKLSGKKFAKVVCSPLKRAQQTLDIINPNCEDISYDKRIIEINFGPYEGKSTQEFDFKGFWNVIDNDSFEGVEHISDLEKRVRSLVEDLLNVKGDILMISHGGVGCALKLIFEGLPKDNSLLSFIIPNAEPIAFDLKKYHPARMPVWQS